MINPFEIRNEVNSRKSILKIFIVRIVILSIVFAVVYPVWGFGYFLANELLIRRIGYYTDQIQVSGTGSMYPTFPKGHGKDPIELSEEVVSAPGMLPYPNGFVFRDKRYLGYDLKRGDIVVIEDEKIRDITDKVYGTPGGWVKRIIGLPGDKIEIREGLVYLNELPLKEEYTALPRSTFGQNFLSECKELVVSTDLIFVMGDNRKGSGDSREIGFIPISSVNHVLPLQSQIGVWDTNWRDSSNDLSEAAKIRLDKLKYLELLNERRKEFGVPELVYQSKLEISSGKRASAILKHNDFSYEATRSGYTMKDALREAKYSNIVTGEIVRQGYYEASELLENELEFPESIEFLTDPDFDEIGISEIEGEIDSCPTQVIVLHFAGYIPPNYKLEDIESWKSNLSKLKEIQPGWLKLKEFNEFYSDHKVEVDRINQIIETRINNVTLIVNKMEANQWFTDSEKKIIENETLLANEQDELANRLNSSSR